MPAGDYQPRLLPAVRSKYNSVRLTMCGVSVDLLEGSTMNQAKSDVVKVGYKSSLPKNLQSVQSISLVQ